MTAHNAQTGFKRTVKPTGAMDIPRPDQFECNTCGSEPYQCWYCYQFTCHSCTRYGLKCDHCQRPKKDS